MRYMWLYTFSVSVFAGEGSGGVPFTLLLHWCSLGGWEVRLRLCLCLCLCLCGSLSLSLHTQGTGRDAHAVHEGGSSIYLSLCLDWIGLARLGLLGFERARWGTFFFDTIWCSLVFFSSLLARCDRMLLSCVFFSNLYSLVRRRSELCVSGCQVVGLWVVGLGCFSVKGASYLSRF